MTRTVRRLAPVVLVAAPLLLAAGAIGQQRTAAGEWPRIGGDGGSTRYSPLDQVTPQNVGRLRIAWTWRADNFGRAPEYKNEVTPIMVGGTLYFTAGDRRAVIAANAGTGETLWTWRMDEGARSEGVRRNNRGVSYWSDGRRARILVVTPGYQLVSLDARTGLPDTDFGEEGVVDMTKAIEKDANFDPAIGHLMNTSPP